MRYSSEMNSPVGLVIVVAMLLVFGGIGIAHVIDPDRFIRRSGRYKGGELLTDWNRFGFRFAGAVFAGFAAYLLYQVLHG